MNKILMMTSITLLAIVLGLGSVTPAISSEIDPFGDEDGDGIINMDDNCIMTANPEQSDIDDDDIGNLCDTDNSYTAATDCRGVDPTIWWTGTGATGFKTFELGTGVIDWLGVVVVVLPDVNEVDVSTNVVSATKGEDVVTGSPSADLLKVGKGNDFGCGRAGNDTLQGGHGEDELEGNDDDDLLKGGHDDDKLFGGDEDDTLQGGRGVDELDGGADTDDCDAGNPKDGDPDPTTCE